MRFKPSLSRSLPSHCASYYSIALQQFRGLLLRHIAVSGIHPIPLLRQSLLHLFRNKDRPMLPTSTSKRHRQVALPLLDVVRQEKLQHLRSLIQELFRLRKLQHVLRHPGIFSRQLAKLRDKMRIRQKAHVEYKIRLRRDTILETEAVGRDHQTPS